MAGNLTAMIAAAFSGGAAPPVTSDPYFDYTTLLLPGTGTNGAQNNTFLDSSSNTFTVTRNGNTTQGTFSPFSQTGWGNYFNGSSTLDVTSASFNPSGAFTIEFWFYGTDSATSSQGLVSTWPSGLSPGQGILIWKSGSVCEIQIGNASTGGTVIGTFTWATYLNQWNHLALVRNSSDSCAVFLNGNRLAAPVTKSGSPGQTALSVGRAFPNNASAYFTGYMSNVSFVSGSNVYNPANSTITVPTAPLSTSTANQALLTCQANRFVDSNTATTAKTITLTGSPTVVAFSPFNPSAAYSAATNGGSGYFDGNGDTVNLSYNAALQLTSTTTFTIEGFVYFNSVSAQQYLLSNWTTASNGYAIATGVAGFANTELCFYDGSGWRKIGDVTIGQWFHFACVSSGTSSTAYIYLNGVQTSGAFTVSANISNGSSGLFLMSQNNSSAYLNGYLSNFRLIKGSNIYPNGTSFTPPTAPLTAITNTSLLLNYTNAGIYDATSKNDLETVGDAKISTAISAKWGSGCMYFDGTGDGLIAPKNVLYEIGSGDWTWETWAYSSSYSATQIFTAFEAVATGYSNQSWVIYASAGKMGIEISNGSSAALSFTTSANIPTNAWTHLAITRSGSTWRMFINGTLDATTGSYSGTPNVPASALLGIGFGPGRLPFTGYLQDVRITKGYARYTTSFTAPTAAFPTL